MSTASRRRRTCEGRRLPTSRRHRHSKRLRAPQASTPRGTGQLAQTPDINQIRVANRNPISRAAAPLLLLLGRLHLTMTAEQFDALMRDVYNSIKTFEKELRNAGITDDQIRSAAYALCATSDDIVQNLPTAGRHQWTQYSMLTQFFGQATGGVEFFSSCWKKAKQDPGRNYGVLEVMHACLSLGFYGKYRAIQGGQQGAGAGAPGPARDPEAGSPASGR
ncbi:type IVB secretion system protein IcmH/DotU [Roseibium salinum]|nr:type IVB secretion system protein IcmH/DotU [Roseibium salinum]